MREKPTSSLYASPSLVSQWLKLAAKRLPLAFLDEDAKAGPLEGGAPAIANRRKAFRRRHRPAQGKESLSWPLIYFQRHIQESA